MTGITGRFNWDVPEVLTSLVEGYDLKAVHEELKKTLGEKAGWYDIENGVLRGSNLFISARIDSILRLYAVRTANLYDLSRPEVMEKIEDKFYTNAPALVLRTMNDPYEGNQPLIKIITEEVEKHDKRVQLPLMINGFDVVQWTEDSNGYGLKIVPRDDFSVVHDERLDGKYFSERFSEVDELGLPKFDKNGKRTWYARDKGLSGLCLDWDLDLYWDGDLAGSSEDGRVVLVSDEAIF